MKALKKVLLLLIALSLTVCMFACKAKDECKNHKDTNGDGLCEECGEKVSNKKDDEEEKATTNDSAMADGTSLKDESDKQEKKFSFRDLFKKDKKDDK